MAWLIGNNQGWEARLPKCWKQKSIFKSVQKTQFQLEQHYSTESTNKERVHKRGLKHTLPKASDTSTKIKIKKFCYGMLSPFLHFCFAERLLKGDFQVKEDKSGWEFKRQIKARHWQSHISQEHTIIQFHTPFRERNETLLMWKWDRISYDKVWWWGRVALDYLGIPKWWARWINFSKPLISFDLMECALIKTDEVG